MVRDRRYSKNSFTRKNYAVTGLIGEVLLIALVVAFAATISTLVYLWALGTSPSPNYISCNYEQAVEHFTVVKGAEIKWSQCIVTLYNESNDTTITITVDGNNMISAGDIIDVSSYVSAGNSYIFTIVAKSPSVVLYIYSWHQ